MTRLLDDRVHRFTHAPDRVNLYLPNGEVHVLRDVTNLGVCSEPHLLTFTDREGKDIITTLPFTLVFSPQEKSHD